MDFNELIKLSKIEYNSLFNSDEIIILIGAATCGNSAGAQETAIKMGERLKEEGIVHRFIEVGCIGLCYLEPIITIIKPKKPGIFYGQVNPHQGEKLVEEYIIKDKPHSGLVLGTIGGKMEGLNDVQEFPVLKLQKRRILRNCGFIDPENILHYLAQGGYQGLKQALTKKPKEILEILKKSGLRGRGGAGFPTWLKWKLCQESEEKIRYVICNADEGDPGAFMNRSLLESDPHSILEGMVIAGYTIGAKKGYVYCRAEYPLALKRLKHAINEMKEHRLLGEKILDSNFSFEIEVKEGAGAFVCGEETALISSIEGKRGMPRTRPPFPTTSGLWEKPTIINNVETMASVALIMQQGEKNFARYGTAESKGTKTFSLVGKVRRTGLIEVPLGTTLKEVIYDIGGGIPENKEFKAVQIGGPSGGCLPQSFLDTSIDYDSLSLAGAIMGSGGLVVMDQNTCMVEVARYFLEFIQKESCGKCVPCRLGTKQMLDILTDITEGKGSKGDLELLKELSSAIQAGSLCGLGQTAPNPVLTTMKFFGEEYIAHVESKVCDSLSCKALIEYHIIPEKCEGCMLCLQSCPVKAISGEKKKPHVIDPKICIKCGTCIELCSGKYDAIEVLTQSH